MHHIAQAARLRMTAARSANRSEMIQLPTFADQALPSPCPPLLGHEYRGAVRIHFAGRAWRTNQSTDNYAKGRH